MQSRRPDGKTESRIPLDKWFPRSVVWRSNRDRLLPFIGQVRDGAPGGLPPPQTERLLQCVWYDSALRPADLRTAEGEPVRVLSPGRWNLEAGPDFLGATLELGPERRRISGDVEVHQRPSDWEAHGHGGDPRYRNVRVHVTYIAGRAPVSLPRAAVRIALRDALAANPRFAFDQIDSAAYPYAMRTAPCPCAAILAGWSVDRRIELLESAGEERLRRKAERLISALNDRSPDQVFYEETCAALGYRDNKAVFRRLAERLPLDELRSESKGDPEMAYALLAGLSGLLPETPRPGWDSETRRWIRHVWDVWWKRSARWSDRALCRDEWVLAGFRPSNHPLRRLAAAAWLFARPSELLPDLRACRGPANAPEVKRMVRRLSEPAGGYWERRLTLGGTVQKKSVALLGAARAGAILNNALFPLLAALGEQTDFYGGWTDALPLEGEAGVLRMTAVALFGPDVPPSLIRPALRRQGLLQIFQDYCIHDRSGCQDCAFQELLRGA